MKTMTVIGVLLIVAGVLALVYRGITYTTREEVLKLGPLEATTETEKTIPLPPVVGVAAIAGGVILLVAASRRKM